MSPDSIATVRSTWRRVRPNEQHVAEQFYRLLFELDPSLRSLFRGDMVAQGRKLTAMLDVVVARLDRLDEIAPIVVQLGRRHAAYGVTDAHYETVAIALLATLRGGLGAAWTPAVEAAWTAAYTTLAAVMREAAPSAVRAG
jgi:hemoglobin-like flavoprotein